MIYIYNYNHWGNLHTEITARISNQTCTRRLVNRHSIYKVTEVLFQFQIRRRHSIVDRFNSLFNPQTNSVLPLLQKFV